jgi:2-amino-4-hydroxy-6-hydroxymethyldihydropteridine diphosphokinase
MREPVTAWVALGANLGQAEAQIRSAMDHLRQHPAVHDWCASPLYVSAPHQASGPDFVNAVARFNTALCAPGLLDLLQGIELQAGRERPYPNAPRTLDLDLLFFGDARIDSPRLSVPHPRWRSRAFVLVPLADLNPERVPAECLRAVSDQPIRPLDPP